MKRTNPTAARGSLIAVCCVLALLTAAVPGQAEDLEGLLQQVGEEYAKSYASPFLYAFGPSMNSGMYSTADIPIGKLTFGITIRASAAQLDEADQSFRRVMEVDDLGDYSDDPLLQGRSGTIVMSGPTIFGDTDTDGTLVGYVNGIPVLEDTTIPGLVDTKLVPMLTPEFALGGVAGLKLVIRWLPEIDLDDYGKFKYLGYGLQWNTAQVLQNLPVDLMVGFGKQKLEIGTLIETNASSYFAAVSKEYAPVTVYGGIAIEDSDMAVSYTFEGTDQFDTQEIAFKVDGIQDSRMTLGATLDLGLKLNAEVAKGKMTTFSGGLILGF